MPSATPESMSEYSGMNARVVRAGAGAGKTTELVQRVLAIAKEFKRKNNRWPRLVVTTFTRKATQELRERLLEASLKHEDQQLVEFIQRRSLLHISTIHGVLSLFLSRYGSKIGLNPKFSFLDERQENRLLKKVLRDCLSDPQEAEAVEALLSQIHLEKLLNSLKSYLELRFEENSPLRMATEKDAAPLQREKDLEWVKLAEELHAVLSDNEKGASWETYLGLLKSTCDLLRKSSDQRVLLLRNFFESKGRPQIKNSDEQVKELREKVQHYAKECDSWADSKAGWAAHSELATAFGRLAETVFEKLFAQKISTSTLTIQDLELFSLKLIHDHQEAAQHFSEEWDYWLIDEYQDTSPRQVFLLKNLIGNSNSFKVGDPQQSIYLFRGARSEVFQQVELENEQAGGQTLYKMENYRSRAELLTFFNQFFTHLGAQFKPMNPAKESRQPEAPAAHFYACPLPTDALPLEGEADSGSSIEHRAVIQRCLELIQSGVAPEQICVLSQTNRELEKIASLAFKFHIPVQVHAASKFYSRREIKDALALMKFLINPSDNLNLLELLRSPWFLISDSELVIHCTTYAENFWPKIRSALAEHGSVKRLVRLQQAALSRGLGQAWAEGLMRSGLLLGSRIVEPSGRGEANLWKLINLLKQEEKKPGFNYLEFSERAESSAQELESGSDGDATPVEEPQRVNLMTIHASKGLQFDHIILPSAGKLRNQRRSDFFTFYEAQKIFCLSVIDPESSKAHQNILALESSLLMKQRELTEYDRRLYVALTRARFDVTLIWSATQEKSWAARMWKPTGPGVQVHGVFSTRYLQDFLPKPESLQLAMPPVLAMAAPLSKPDGHKLTTISVSRLLDLQNLEKGSIQSGQKENSQARVKKALQGVETHRLFESLKYRGAELPKKLVQSPEFQFLEQWQSAKMLRWIQNGEVEWGFCASLGDTWIQGQLDMWSTDEDGSLIIVDYKTGSTKYSEKAFEQLEVYAWALRKVKDLPGTAPVKLLVCYPAERKILERLAPNSLAIQDKIVSILKESNS